MTNLSIALRTLPLYCVHTAKTGNNCSSLCNISMAPPHQHKRCWVTQVCNDWYRLYCTLTCWIWGDAILATTIMVCYALKMEQNADRFLSNLLLYVRQKSCCHINRQQQPRRYLVHRWAPFHNCPVVHVDMKTELARKSTQEVYKKVQCSSFEAISDLECL